MKKTLLLASAVIIFLVSTPKGQDQEEKNAVLDQFLHQETPSLLEYHATRRMEGSMSLLGLKGWMEIETTLSPAKVFAYQVTGEGGSSLVLDRLRSLLQKEVEATRNDEYEKAAFSRENYVLNPLAKIEGAWKISAKPRKKEELLLDGEIFLNSLGELLRTEGKLVKSPSPSLRNVHVIIYYKQIAGVRMPESLESKAQVIWGRFIPAGSATLSVQYQYQSVNSIELAPTK